MIKTVQSKFIPILIALAILLIALPQRAQDHPVGEIDSLAVVADSLDSLYTFSDSSAFAFSDSLDSLFTLQDTIVIDSIYYKADSIYYYVQEERIMLAGNAFLRYQTATISSDTISVDMQQEKAASEGQALMKEGSHQLLGDEIRFDIADQDGMIKQGATKFDKGYYYGEEVRKVGKEVFDIDNGYFTTCDSQEPHYYIYSRDMRLYRDDKIVAKPVVFYVNYFPVLALPYATFTIKRGRQSGFLVAEPGYNSSDGKYLKNIAYFIAISDYANLTTTLDYMELSGWETRVEGDYTKQYDFNGNYDARLTERNGGLNSSDSYQWYFYSHHHHEIAYKTTFESDLKFVSNKNIFENSDDINERLKEEITSSMSYKTYVFDRLLSASSSYTENLSTDEKSITLPSVSYSLPSKPVYELFIGTEDLEEISADDDDTQKWWEPLSYSYSFKGVHTGTIVDEDPDLEEVLWESHRDSTGAYVSEHHAGVLNTAGLRYSWKAAGWLDLTQSLTTNAVVIDRDRDNNKAAAGYDYSTSSKASFSLYGTRQMPAMYVRAVRHIMTPSVAFTYKPDFQENSDLYSFGSVGVNSSKKSRTLRYALSNTWQLKLRGKDGGSERKLNDFFKIDSAVSYNLEGEGKKFGTISHRLSFKPATAEVGSFNFKWTNSGSIYEDPYDFNLNSWSVSTGFTISGDASFTEYFPEPLNRFETSKFFLKDSLATEDEGRGTLDTIDKVEQLSNSEQWSIGVTHDYSQRRGIDDFTSNLRIRSEFRLTTNWTVSYSNYIDLQESEFISHELILTRMLHCWKLTFRWTKEGDFWDYRLSLFAIKLPDALKFTTSDHKH